MLPPLEAWAGEASQGKGSFHAFQAEGTGWVKAQRHAEDMESLINTEYSLTTLSEPQQKMVLAAQ